MHEHLMHMPIDDALSAGRDALFSWTVKLHNAVNASLGRPEMDIQESRRYYETATIVAAPMQSPLSASVIFAIIITGVSLAVVGAFLFSRTRKLNGRSGMAR